MAQTNVEIQGDIVLDEDNAFHGMVIGSVTVPKGITFQLHGMVTGHLVVEEGATAIVHGKVNGAVINKGGSVTIHGMVGAIMDQNPVFATKVLPNAVITGNG